VQSSRDQSLLPGSESRSQDHMHKSSSTCLFPHGQIIQHAALLPDRLLRDHLKAAVNILDDKFYFWFASSDEVKAHRISIAVFRSCSPPLSDGLAGGDLEVGCMLGLSAHEETDKLSLICAMWSWLLDSDPGSNDLIPGKTDWEMYGFKQYNYQITSRTELCLCWKEAMTQGVLILSEKNQIDEVSRVNVWRSARSDCNMGDWVKVDAMERILSDLVKARLLAGSDCTRRAADWWSRNGW